LALDKIAFDDSVPGMESARKKISDIETKLSAIIGDYLGRLGKYEITESKRQKLIEKKRGEPASDEKPESEQGNPGVS
jgi:hypothetical protein